MSEQLCVSKVVQAGGVVSHGVSHPGNEEGLVAVPMLTLMHAGEVAEMSGRAVGGDSAFVHTRERRGVVSSIEDSGVAHVMMLGHDVKLGQLACLLEVTVGDLSSRVREGH